nr:hypothetical protein [Rhizobium terrae]
MALQAANDADEDAVEMVNRKVGWHRLPQIKPGLEAMVESSDALPLVLAAERHGNIRKFTGAFLQAFTFHWRRRHDPLLAAIATLKNALCGRASHLAGSRARRSIWARARKKLIVEDGKPDRRLYEIATLTHLRDRLNSRDIWVEGSRSFRPIDEHLMPKPAFVTPERGELSVCFVLELNGVDGACACELDNGT